MSRTKHRDLSESGSHPDLFGAEEAVPSYGPDPDKVRAPPPPDRCGGNGRRNVPWDAGRTSLYRTIFPEMPLFLPEEEGVQLRFACEAEMARLPSA